MKPGITEDFEPPDQRRPPPYVDAFAGEHPARTPEKIGRYSIERLLGKGGFGLVYLARDEQLQRPVAIKVPHARLVAATGGAEAYLTEARTVANLDHPHVVPVFDVGSSPEYPCYIVSKYIDGTDLATRLKESRLSLRHSVELVATVAETLQHAHMQGLVHRDVKPGNILLDRVGQPFVGDFGLALREQDMGHGPRYAGTPAYMSPEQARGEGHRVDGRSDIFSLGVVLYELLVGRKPFRGDSPDELIEKLTTWEPRPPRQYDNNIPKELDRICLKALSKRASDRYSTARDMADDLRHFLAELSGGENAVIDLTTPRSAPSKGGPSSSASNPPVPASEAAVIKVVPKGLRSFDVTDADFYLELLPGPRDRDGLPDSIRFWRTRLEETDADSTFAVGLIYGPSGCGKSSLVKAGLLPRLTDNVISVYVEATPEETETRLLHGLRKRCPALDEQLNLKDSLVSLRRGQGVPTGKKVAIMLDQFEQWLHARAEENCELVQALRQCDGGRVQCVVMVRDDFWMAATRFMRELEIRLVDGQNSAAVDLFPIHHAEKVLAAFGRAFGTLPENPRHVSKEQKEFLTQSIAGLAEEGKVNCVRLALFAEMMKGKSWNPALLKEVGGTQGVGVTFLEETFSASTAPPEHRYHQRAARTVLKALLPESGTDIKGEMKSSDDLQAVSGYALHPADFAHLIRILDRELRLITPTDPDGDGMEADAPTSNLSSHASGRYYQLTHDYLVPSLRDWLTRKQKETRRGRAELLLGDRAVVWHARPENRQLPSLWQWCQISWLTPKRSWTAPQRKMMAKAGRYHVQRSLVLAAVLTILGWCGHETFATLKAQALTDRLLEANIADVPKIVHDIDSYRRWVNPLLRIAYQKAAASQESRKQLHASLALLPIDAGQAEFLFGRLLDAPPHEVSVIRDSLFRHKDPLLPRLWGVAQSPEKGRESQRLRAAAALATFDPKNMNWTLIQEEVVNDLVGVPAVYLSIWLDSLRDVKAALLPQLAIVYCDPKRRETERSLATDILADWADDDPQLLANLLMNSDAQQFAIIFSKLEPFSDRGAAVLAAELDKRLPPELPTSDATWETLALRQANSAAALLKLNHAEKVWPLLKCSPDPRMRNYLIHWLQPRGVDADVIIQRLQKESDTTIQRALLLGLGEYNETNLRLDVRSRLMPRLQELYRTCDDPGLHASVEWLLRQWQQDAWLKQMNEEWARDAQKRLVGIEQRILHDQSPSPPQWYVNGQGQTMLVIPGPVEFLMGTPSTEANPGPWETQHRRRIGRSFAISAKSVTVGQYQRFDSNYKVGSPLYERSPDFPAHSITVYSAARYCNWLSQQERIAEEDWCYVSNEKELVLKANYLSLRGFRLPTEAEFEYALRAGTVTAAYFGETDVLLPNYGWLDFNSHMRLWPVGQLKPNDFGVFDGIGNVFTWCQNLYRPYPVAEEVINDTEGDLVYYREQTFVRRGGAYSVRKPYFRSGWRNDNYAYNSNPTNGFRVARTIRLAATGPHSE